MVSSVAAMETTKQTTQDSAEPAAAAEELAAALRPRTTGPVHVPGSAGFDAHRTGVQLLDAHRPSVVVAAENAGDVRAAVQTAARFGVPVAAHRTGHGRGAGMSGGVLIATAGLSGVRVDPRRRTAWVPAGARWADVIGAAAPHGLAPLSGSAPGVGAVSYTLGGGVGLLARRYGFAADHVHRIDLVTPDGAARTVAAGSDDELFWAVRGAGASLGVATGIEIGLFPVGELYGGSLSFDAAAEPGVVEAWRSWCTTLPDEFTSGLSVAGFPDDPAFPPPVRGRTVAQVSLAWSGPPAEGAALVEPLRAAAPVLDGALGPLPYAESGRIFNDPEDPAAFAGRSVLVDDLPGSAGAGLVHAVADAPFFAVAGLRHLGGALARPPAVANAVGHRSAAFAATALAFTGVGGDPADTAAMRGFRDAAAGLLAEHAVGRSATLAFGPQTPGEVAEAYDPADQPRLTALAARLDPDRILHSHRPLH